MLRKRHGSGIEPAVDHLRYAPHGLTAVRTGDGDLVDIRPVQLHRLRRRIAGQLMKFLSGTDGLHVAAALALPYIQRCAPVTVSGDTPVLDVLQPVAETALADGFRNPVDRLIVAHQIVPHRRHLDKPGLSRIIDQRRITAPAEGIIMLKLRRVEQFSFFIQIL